MEITIRVPELARALQRVQGIVDKKATMPILSGALFRTRSPDNVEISATDLELALTADYDARVAREGALTIPARALHDIVRALPPDDVTIKQTQNNWVEIRCGKVRYRMVALSSENFPALPAFTDVDYFTVESAMLRGMIDRTLYAISTDETRYNLTGAYCESIHSGAGLRMVATDGHRLALVERPIADPPLMKEGVIVPRKGLMELRRLLEDDDGTTTPRLGFVQNSAIFRTERLALTIRLIDGRFPDYQQVLPKSHSRTMKVARAPLAQALKRTSLLSPDKGQGVCFDLTENTLTLTTQNPDVGDATEELDVQYQGERLRIGFNVRYVMDALAVLTDEEVVIELIDELSPGVFRGAASEDYRAVVMPMRI